MQVFRIFDALSGRRGRDASPQMARYHGPPISQTSWSRQYRSQLPTHPTPHLRRWSRRRSCTAESPPSGTGIAAREACPGSRGPRRTGHLGIVELLEEREVLFPPALDANVASARAPVALHLPAADFAGL